MLIGLTGLIGAGKSEVARIFKKNGAFVISADKIGKDVVDNNKTILKKLIQIFGQDIISKSGHLNRKKLGQLAFSSECCKEKLNSIVHPALLKELSAQVKEAKKMFDIVVIDAALLIQWGWDKKVDKTILVDTILRKRIQRLKAKGYTGDEVILEKKVENIIAGLSKRG